jgi:hypothetical protein
MKLISKQHRLWVLLPLLLLAATTITAQIHYAPQGNTFSVGYQTHKGGIANALVVDWVPRDPKVMLALFYSDSLTIGEVAIRLFGTSEHQKEDGYFQQSEVLAFSALLTQAFKGDQRGWQNCTGLGFQLRFCGPLDRFNRKRIIAKINGGWCVMEGKRSKFLDVECGLAVRPFKKLPVAVAVTMASAGSEATTLGMLEAEGSPRPAPNQKVARSADLAWRLGAQIYF